MNECHLNYYVARINYVTLGVISWLHALYFTEWLWAFCLHNIWQNGKDQLRALYLANANIYQEHII